VNLVPNHSERREGNTNSPESSLLKFFRLAYHHSHFFIFFATAFLGAAHFLQLGCFGLDALFKESDDWKN